MKIHAASVALCALLLAAPVLAQTTTQEKTTPTPEVKAPSTTAPAPGADIQYYRTETGEFRASKLVGQFVKNSAGETIGDINEIIVTKDGKVAAAVIGVGGFLGMGEHEVAVSFPSLNLTRDANDNVVVLLPAATKEGLKAAPEWKWAQRN